MTFKKIRFVTDSTCDLPQNLLDQHNIRVVPCYINHGENSYPDDGKALSREDFYRQLPAMRPSPTTAAPSPGDTKAAIEAAFAEADHVIVMTVAAKLSGTLNAMRLGAADLPPDRVTLLDSESVTMGLGWPVLIGAETAAATGSVEETLAVMERVKQNTHVYAALETLEFLRRSGRVGWAAAGIGALLQIKPILHVFGGEVHQAGRVRTFTRAVDELIRFCQTHAPIDRLAILHATNLQGAMDLQNRLADLAPSDTIIVSITPTIGTHIGPGGLGLVPVSKSWRTG